MHSKIFQISNAPIDKDDYSSPECYYDDSQVFADYIGEPIKGETREDCIKYLAESISDLFSYDKEAGAFVYKGKDALHEFKQKWLEAIREITDKLTADNLIEEHNVYRLRRLTLQTHLDSSFRFHINEWNGWAGPMEDLVEYARYQLKEGDRIYVGAVIDYHY